MPTSTPVCFWDWSHHVPEWDIVQTYPDCGIPFWAEGSWKKFGGYQEIKKKKDKWLEVLSYERILKYINTQHNLAKWQLSAQLTIYRHWKGIYRRMIEELQVSLKIAGKVMEETSHLDKGRGSFDNDILQAITFSQGDGGNNNESAEWSMRNGEEVA